MQHFRIVVELQQLGRQLQVQIKEKEGGKLVGVITADELDALVPVLLVPEVGGPARVDLGDLPCEEVGVLARVASGLPGKAPEHHGRPVEAAAVRALAVHLPQVLGLRLKPGKILAVVRKVGLLVGAALLLAATRLCPRVDRRLGVAQVLFLLAGALRYPGGDGVEEHM
eukprot:CAMPEP_0182913992 /NCGR_PEP_ID=MMETSP0034_2-20130328/38321_1 /TAXON_ID=156128 /ORGANISM="Nephroselmis pyriformis, Strain CCMP717" /LENGTH=168 /DNA_ID=CAMNT_0025050721 /DNA_START=1099 /DNA_END=1606 /DNA_ORIENTATION=+